RPASPRRPWRPGAEGAAAGRRRAGRRLVQRSSIHKNLMKNQGNVALRHEGLSDMIDSIVRPQRNMAGR
ncbi:hypothetical protein ACRPM7_30725, partial [Burkholderia vietnamiensis]|uniref:hypothetical protein n=1 Tax=Burkholderia vietnamiensis TaxID=60552 RepID=UPI003D7A08E0